MTQELVEQVLRGYEAFNRGDLEAALEGFDSGIEWIGLDDLLENETSRGREGVLRFWESWREVFEGFRIEVEETIDAGDQVIAMASVGGRGRDSGARVETPSFAHVWTFRDGLAVRMEMMPSKADALAAVGLT